MSLFDLIFGSGKKIYSTQIEKIPASRFNRQVKLTIGGQTATYNELGLKNVLVNLARGGITLTRLEEKLKGMGAINNQLERRKEIVGILKDECLGKK